jgi:hypothetical protein
MDWCYFILAMWFLVIKNPNSHKNIILCKLVLVMIHGRNSSQLPLLSANHTSRGPIVNHLTCYTWPPGPYLFLSLLNRHHTFCRITRWPSCLLYTISNALLLVHDQRIRQILVTTSLWNTEFKYFQPSPLWHPWHQEHKRRVVKITRTICSEMQSLDIGKSFLKQHNTIV